MAMASSAPELFTSVLDTFSFRNHIGIGTIIGSAIFNILVIIAVSALLAKEPLTINPSVVKRDVGFYVLVCMVLALTTMSGSNTPWNMWTLVTIQIYYVVYLAWKTTQAQARAVQQNFNRIQSRRTNN